LLSETNSGSASQTQFIKICETKDVAKGTGKSFRVGSLFLAVYNSEGKFFATCDICSHEHELLSEGWLDGHTVECPRHGSIFDLVTGEAKTLPATEPIEVFQVEIRGDDLMVGIPQEYLNSVSQK
jgi:3-phenylpropionate/trans-cinnamate dioxygenase ferredoxin component